MNDVQLLHGDCKEVLKGLSADLVDSIVTDPPYGLSFMGKKWDYDVPSVEIWEACLRVLKPGGFLLAFAGTRTQHRMAVNIENAGFEIRDMIAWVYGSGFPKSLNIGKAVDKLQGNKRETVLVDRYRDGSIRKETEDYANNVKIEANAQSNYTTKGTSEYEGWGTALKPALEPITVARKPLSEKNVALNVLEYGTGGINIDECRVEHNDPPQLRRTNAVDKFFDKKSITKMQFTQGRFPANIIHDGSDEVVSLFPERKSGGTTTEGAINNWGDPRKPTNNIAPSKGSAARFFYCAKASAKDREEGCGTNVHPTIKPTQLMRYLVRLVTPKEGICLDPFMGSGATGKACMLENFGFIGVEMDAEYLELARKRIEIVKSEKQQGEFEF